MTNAELVVLSLIAEKPRHGYEIEVVIEARGMREWTEVGFSSIYYIQTVGPNTNPSNRYTNQFLDAKNVSLAIQGQFFKGSALRNIFRPSRKRFIFYFDLTQNS